MPRRRIHPGESLNKAISAADWNAMLDLLNHRDKAGLWSPAEAGQSPRTTRVPRSSVVWLCNATGAHLPQFSIVGVDGPAVDASVTYGNFQREVTVSATTPTNSHRGKFAVTCDAIPAGQCGWACVGGVVQAKVDIDHEDHQFCEVENNNTSSLKSGFAGSAQIVWRKEDSGAGTWCFVRLGNQRTFVRKATADATISAGSSGDVTIQHNGTDSETVTAYYTWADFGLPDIDANDEIWVVWMEDERKWYVLPVVAGSGGTTIPTCHFYGFRLYRPTDGYRSGSDIQWNKIGSIYWINSIGDVAGCNLDVKTATVTSYTDYAMKVTAAGWYEFDWQVTGYEDIGNIDTGTDHGGYVTVTSEPDGAVSAHTHTFTGSNSTTDTHSGHTHTIGGGPTATDSGGSHSHAVTPLGSLSSDGSAADHTHDVKVPHGYWHTYALCSIKWRAAGGAEGDWDLVATASTGSYVLPSSAEYGSANGTPYHSCAPKGFMYFDADTELVFRLHHVKKINDGDFNDLGYTFVQNRAYTNLTVRYHGNSLATDTHYP